MPFQPFPHTQRGIDFEKPVTVMRRDFIEAHYQDKDDGRCLLWPFDLTIAPRQFIKGYGHVSPGRLMCEKAHGPAPLGKKFAIAVCNSKAEGCIHPQHLEWVDGRERARINAAIHEMGYDVRLPPEEY